MPGDFLVFQLESGYSLLRVIAIEESENERTWHLTIYRDFYLDVESAEQAVGKHKEIAVQQEHIALTNRAFESTQVACLKNIPVSPSEIEALEKWKSDPDREISDRSVRLLLGIR